MNIYTTYKLLYGIYEIKRLLITVLFSCKYKILQHDKFNKNGFQVFRANTLLVI